MTITALLLGAAAVLACIGDVRDKHRTLFNRSPSRRGDAARWATYYIP